MTFAKEMLSFRLLLEASQVCLSFQQAVKMSPRLSISTLTKPRLHMVPLVKCWGKGEKNHEINYIVISNVIVTSSIQTDKENHYHGNGTNIQWLVNAYIVCFIRIVAKRGRRDNFDTVRRFAAAGWCCIWKTDKIRYGSIHSFHRFGSCFTLDGA